jgi:glycosyltransferase involved in cell wall biosynthesis
VAGPFRAGERWLGDFVPGDRHRFTMVGHPGPELNWHQARRGVTGGRRWVQYLRQSRQALRTGDGVITVLPQAAAAVGLTRRLVGRHAPVLAWFFNTELPDAARRMAARAAVSGIDRFVVHSRRETEVYPAALGLPAERFHFVPLQYGGELQTDDEDVEDPFVFATGSGFRDYATFFAAIGQLGYRTLVLSGPRALAGLDPPRSVSILDQLPRAEIHRLVRRARVNVVPMSSGGITAGLVTIVEAYRHERTVVGTMRPGLEDYFHPGVDCLTHALGDAAGLAEAIEAVWSDDALRRRLNAGAKAFADANCTDEVAGAALGRHLDALAAGVSRRRPPRGRR